MVRFTQLLGWPCGESASLVKFSTVTIFLHAFAFFSLLLSPQLLTLLPEKIIIQVYKKEHYICYKKLNFSSQFCQPSHVFLTARGIYVCICRFTFFTMYRVPQLKLYNSRHLFFHLPNIFQMFKIRFHILQIWTFYGLS